jgi:hypothetical protein
MVELKTYKLEELEDGKTYIAKGDSTVYRMKDGELEYRYDDEWRTSLMSYNWLRKQEFIIFSTPRKIINFEQALKSINDGLEVQSEVTGNKYKMLDNLIMQKTLINGLKLKGIKDKFSLEFGEINGFWFVEEE